MKNFEAPKRWLPFWSSPRSNLESTIWESPGKQQKFGLQKSVLLESRMFKPSFLKNSWETVIDSTFGDAFG